MDLHCRTQCAYTVAADAAVARPRIWAFTLDIFVHPYWSCVSVREPPQLDSFCESPSPDDEEDDDEDLANDRFSKHRSETD